MRAYININQKAFSELAILKSTKIDLIDALKWVSSVEMVDLI